MNRLAYIGILLTAICISIPSQVTSKFSYNTPEDQKKREANEAFLDRIIDEALGEQRDNFKVMDSYIGESANYLRKHLILRNENDKQWTRKWRIYVSNEKKPVNYSAEYEKASKRRSRFLITEYFLKRGYELGKFKFEMIKFSNNEIFLLAEGISKSENPKTCILVTRTVGHGKWESEQLFLGEVEEDDLDQKNKIIANFKNNKIVEQWRQSTSSFAGGNSL